MGGATGAERGGCCRQAAARRAMSRTAAGCRLAHTTPAPGHPSRCLPAASPANFTPASIFTSIALFSLMRFPLIFLPFALIQLSNALVSMRRLSAYFMLEERTDEVQQLPAPGGRAAAQGLGSATRAGKPVKRASGEHGSSATGRTSARRRQLTAFGTLRNLLASACCPSSAAPYDCPHASMPAGLEIVDGTFFWSEPPANPKGGPGAAGKAAKRAAKKAAKAAAKAAKAAAKQGKAGAEAAAKPEGEVAVQLAGMSEEGKAAEGSEGPADSAREGSPSASGSPSPPPEKEAAKEGGKAGAWWLRDINLKVPSNCFTRAKSPGGGRPWLGFHFPAWACWSAAVPLSAVRIRPWLSAWWQHRSRKRCCAWQRHSHPACSNGAPWAPAWATSRLVQVEKGELVCVVGRVGSGKTSLVQALLGEMERESGRIAVGGRLAYAAQQAWIINASGEHPTRQRRRTRQQAVRRHALGAAK